MSEYVLTVHPFRMGEDKEAAVKVVEEAAETFGAWQMLRDVLEKFETCGHGFCRDRLADEIADTIQACCNLAARYGIDLDAAMERCYERNRDRGRYDVGKPDTVPMSESAQRVFDRLMRESMGDE